MIHWGREAIRARHSEFAAIVRAVDRACDELKPLPDGQACRVSPRAPKDVPKFRRRIG